jgi:Golgi phosphoprotein 3 (GPP34)
MTADLIAIDLLRMARDPATGRISRRGTLAVGLRAALFCELALAGQIVDAAGRPFAAGAESNTHRFLDQLRDAVEVRPGVAWLRWYHHVHGDRNALVKELVDKDRWTPTGRSQYDDVDPDGARELARQMTAVATFQLPARDTRDAVLGMLVVICGAVAVPDVVSGRPPARQAPRPKAMRRELRPLLDVIGPDDDITRVAVQNAVGAAATIVRKVRHGHMLA